MHLRLKPQLLDGDSRDLSDEAHLIPTDPGFVGQSAGLHGFRDRPGHLVGGPVIRTDEQDPLVCSNELEHQTRYLLAAQGLLFQPHRGQDRRRTERGLSWIFR